MGGILLVDDQANSRFQVRTVLNEAGYTDITEASSGDEAIRRYKEVKPDVVFLDIILPGISGKEILKKILEIDPEAKVVMMSVLSRELDRKEVSEAGAFAYFVKPLNEDKLRHIQLAIQYS